MSEAMDRIVGGEVLTEDDREYVEIAVPVWKGKARIQSLNALELINVIEFGKENIGYKLVALCQVDAAGRQVFRLPDEPLLELKDPEVFPAEAAALAAAVIRVKQRNPRATNALSEELIKLNRITMTKVDAAAAEDAQKNDSGEAPTDVSPVS